MNAEHDSMPPVFDLAELAEDLRDIGKHLAARLVRDDCREYAGLIADDVGANTTYRRIIAAQVRAWGAGDDARVVASNAAYKLTDCAACILAALASGDAASRCAGCAEVAS